MKTSWCLERLVEHAPVLVLTLNLVFLGLDLAACGTAHLLRPQFLARFYFNPALPVLDLALARAAIVRACSAQVLKLAERELPPRLLRLRVLYSRRARRDIAVGGHLPHFLYDRVGCWLSAEETLVRFPIGNYAALAVEECYIVLGIWVVVGDAFNSVLVESSWYTGSVPMTVPPLLYRAARSRSDLY